MSKKKKVEIEEMENCPECNSTRITQDYRRGELICEECGLVLDESYIDQGPEWRAFDSEQREKLTRTGAPMNYTIHDKGLSTMVGWGNRDSNGKFIPTRNRAQLYRLRKWQCRIRAGSTPERNLVSALSELARITSHMGLSRNVREAAAMVYRRTLEKNLIRGRSVESVIAATVYAACRQCGVPRTLDEIADSSRVDRKEVGRTYRFIARELTLKLMPTSPQDYTARFCSELGLKENTKSKALGIIIQAEENELTNGRGPTGIAASAIYIASIICGERKTQKEVAHIAGVTEVTIRNRYNELTEKLDIDIVL
jgi:transcription initiation factor TFIIB